MNKKGLSKVVTNLLIILIALVAVGLIWFVTQSLIKESSGEIEIGGLTTSIEILENSVFFDGENLELSVRKKPGGEDVVGLKFIIENQTDSYVYEENFTENKLEDLESKPFIISLTDHLSTVVKVSVYPIYSVKKTQKINIGTPATHTLTTSQGGSGGGGGGGGGGNGEDTGTPVLTLNLISPTQDQNIAQNEIFNYIVEASCSGADCGTITATLDPTLTLRYSETFTDTSDFYISAEQKDSHIISSYYVETNSFSISSNYAYRSFIWFNVSSLPAKINITSATLYLTQSSSLSLGTLSVHKVTQDVDYSVATFNTYDGVNPWTDNNPEQDISQISDDSIAITGQTEFALDVTDSVQEFYNDSTLNHGWMMKLTDISNTGVRFQSTLNSNEGARPRLVIEYTELENSGDDDSLPQGDDSQVKTGAISTTIDATPFYTTSDNPEIFSLSEGQSTTISWQVIPTGDIGGEYEFFATFESDNSQISTQNTAIKNLAIINTQCELTNALWSTTSAIQGETVDLIVEGTNCDGKTLEFEVREDDGLAGSDPAQIQPSSVVISSGQGTTTWVAEYVADTLFCVDFDPEYYFIASVLEHDISVDSRDYGDLLEVSDDSLPQDPPAECGNNIIETGETCDDGNSDSGDGCSSLCSVETGYVCGGEPSVCEEISYDRVFYVDYVNGDDATGEVDNINQPFQHLYSLNSLANAGDLIYLREGTFLWDYFSPVYSGTTEKPITIKAYPGETPIITGSGKYDVIFEIKGSRSYFIIEGLSFESTTAYSGTIFLTDSSSHNIVRNCDFNWGGSVIIQRDSNNNIIENNIFNGTGSVSDKGIGDHIWIKGADYNLIQNNYFTKAGHYVLDIRQYVGGYIAENNILRGNTIEQYWGGGFGVLMNSKNTLIENNTIYFVGEGLSYPKAGIQLMGEDSIVRNNFLIHGSSSPYPQMGLAILSYQVVLGEVLINQNSVDNRIYNNVIYKNGHVGLYMNQKNNAVNTRNKFVNNIIYENDVKGQLTCYGENDLLFEDNKASTPWAEFPNQNYFYNNIILHSDDSGDYPGHLLALYDAYYTTQDNDWQKSLNQLESDYSNYFYNNVEENPQFVDEDNDNFRLSAGSPAIDSGAHLAQTTSSGTSTANVPVTDALFFSDGFGVIAGDEIMVGSDTVTITSIDYDNNILTIDQLISFSSGEPVSLVYSGSAPDIGVYEFE